MAVSANREWQHATLTITPNRVEVTVDYPDRLPKPPVVDIEQPNLPTADTFELDPAFDLRPLEVEFAPGIHDPRVKDFIVKSQVTAAAFYIAYPDATVRDIWKALKAKKALNELLDQA
jgi:hypothetical protein